MKSNRLETAGPACRKALAGGELPKRRREDPAEAGRGSSLLPGPMHGQKRGLQPPRSQSVSVGYFAPTRPASGWHGCGRDVRVGPRFNSVLNQPWPRAHRGDGGNPPGRAPAPRPWRGEDPAAEHVLGTVRGGLLHVLEMGIRQDTA